MHFGSPLSKLRLSSLSAYGPLPGCRGLWRSLLQARLTGSLQVAAGGDEAPEEWVRPQRPALELRVKLAPDEERVVFELGYLDESSVGRGAGEDHPGLGKGVPVAVVDLVAVPVALVDEVLVVDLGRQSAWRDLARVVPEAHGATHLHTYL